ncbi:MAG: FHA domain-containing protein [Actinomycetota bacterium]|jgi:pSer/pThr/pTyr-binding forkhead associated (FHA) protein|nr:FHA domain-containing protein [Actinomycetota bacterium]MDP9481450.1 FHA domain-containing protein [Actinomycetota bacterium]
MLELQVPLLAAKALLLLLLFAFIYAVVSRGIGDLRKIPDDEPYVPGQEPEGRGAAYAPRGPAPGNPELVVEDSEILAPQTRFELRDGETTVGRSSQSNIVLKSDDYASGSHAQLTRHGGLLYVEDLGSTNGTFVNGRKTVGATPVRDGDTVRIGSTTFRYEE